MPVESGGEQTLRGAVVVPTYNEAENIERLVTQILGLGLDLRVIVVDDNSPDGTGQIADRLAAADSHVQVVHRQGKLGLGTAYIAGFKRGIADGMPIILSMDADFSHNPRYIPAMVEMSETYDLVIGSRYVKGGGTEDCTALRKLLSRGANLFAKLGLGLKAHDCTAGFRCYRRHVLEAIELDTIFSSGYSFLVEMIYRCQKKGFSVGETPIIFVNRQRGASKISRLEIIKAVYTVVRLRWNRLPWDAIVAFYHRRRGDRSGASRHDIAAATQPSQGDKRR
jgi:glycosyltransferase involved in cell wall biosynthesis